MSQSFSPIKRPIVVSHVTKCRMSEDISTISQTVLTFANTEKRWNYFFIWIRTLQIKFFQNQIYIIQNELCDTITWQMVTELVSNSYEPVQSHSYVLFTISFHCIQIHTKTTPYETVCISWDKFCAILYTSIIYALSSIRIIIVCPMCLF